MASTSREHLRTTREKLQEVVDAEIIHGNQTAAAAAHGQTRSCNRSRLTEARAIRLKPSAMAKPDVQQELHPKIQPLEKPETTLDKVRDRLRKGACSFDELQTLTGLGERGTTGVLDDLEADGFNLHKLGNLWSIEKAPAPRESGSEARFELKSDDKNRYRFGFVTDNHLCSKYARLDVLNSMYDRFEAAGITEVFNAGNWIDGEARFNKFDLLVHGMDAQLRYLVENYPQRKGITTRFVAGDDHEGWYGQSTGVDIGRYAENKMRDAGRDDFQYLGYMEADIGLVNANTGKAGVMRLVHPGGGSAYAISYSMQKLVESYEGGDKPAVVLGGHYHKMEILNYRNVWIVQGGTTEDQTPFMRKKKLEAHVGGMIIDLEQDPETAAIICCNGIYRYFNRAYYHSTEEASQERFSNSGPVHLRPRTLGGV